MLTQQSALSFAAPVAAPAEAGIATSAGDSSGSDSAGEGGGPGYGPPGYGPPGYGREYSFSKVSIVPVG
jgi:hypothetical protein